MKIQISNIKINEGRRPLDINKVDELIESIKKVGLINPITVMGNSNNNEFVLIAGLHRLKAHEKMGLFEIDANVRLNLNGNLDPAYLELIEIDENLIRNVLHYTERADALVRRKEIYEELYPYTTRESTLKQNLPKDGIRPTDKPSFVTDTSNRTGRSETVIKEELQIGTNLEQEEKKILKEQDINKTESIKIARMDPEERKPVVELFATGQAKKVDEAKKILDPIDKEYEIKAKEIEAQGKRVKKVQDLLNYTKYLGITELHISDYLEMFPKHHHDFISDLESLKNIADEVIEIYRTLNQIRRVK